MAGINYLFPPDKIEDLPSWRFYLHFIAPENYTNEMLAVAKENLHSAEFRIIEFPLGIDQISYYEKTNAVSIPYQVTEENRYKANSLELYESDVWKIMGNMAAAGFQSEIYYQALDWQE